MRCCGYWRALRGALDIYSIIARKKAVRIMASIGAFQGIALFLQFPIVQFVKK